MGSPRSEGPANLGKDDPRLCSSHWLLSRLRGPLSGGRRFCMLRIAITHDAELGVPRVGPSSIRASLGREEGEPSSDAEASVTRAESRV